MTGPEDQCIVQVTDLHLGTSTEHVLHGVNTAQSLDRVLDAIQDSGINPDLFLLTGDLVDQPNVQAYTEVARHFERVGAPCYVIPGNHDDPAMMRSVLDPLGLSSQKSMGLGQWRILLLDSSKAGVSKGHLGDTEMAWLSDEVEQCPEPWILIALHHHPIPAESSWMDGMMLEDSGDFLDYVRSQPRIRAVIFGHIHQSLDRSLSETRLLGTPSTCAQFQPGAIRFTLTDEWPGYRVIVLGRNGDVTSEVVRVSQDH